jgi:hypothetical protein
MRNESAKEPMSRIVRRSEQIPHHRGRKRATLTSLLFIRIIPCLWLLGTPVLRIHTHSLRKYIPQLGDTVADPIDD